ncbi:ATP-binding cassette domain-containing protein [Chlorobium sp. N1]|uniref:ABC transporter ATP-binding protein n=1 Tax=Chlorobium sp. N1 TaxID=2491138 RepID=UPI00103D5615|nr:ATP-binding cassette domain-containing protein [Chlorobium sp. N1]TCD47395.1 ATP-binding cassette domain-containing protein [Chlorobium sp. N1]
MAAILEIRDLTFTHEGASEPLFRELSLSVEEGQHILLKGPSGSGKSSLLRLICRLAAPDSGIIRYRGTPVSEMPPATLRSRVAYVAQIPRMVDGTLEENLLLPFAFASNARRSAPDRALLERMLDEFYLGGIGLDRPAMKLSTGQQQRVALLRTLLLEPDLLLLDEPTSALDPESAAMVFSIMERLNREKGKTLLTVTHSDYRPEGPQVALYRIENRTLSLQP